MYNEFKLFKFQHKLEIVNWKKVRHQIIEFIFPLADAKDHFWLIANT